MNESELVALAADSPWEAYEALMAVEDKQWKKNINEYGKVCESVMKAIGKKSLDAVVYIAEEHDDERIIKFNADALIKSNIIVAYKAITRHLGNEDSLVRRATEAFAAKHPQMAYETAVKNGDRYLLSCAEEHLGMDGVTGKD